MVVNVNINVNMNMNMDIDKDTDTDRFLDFYNAGMSDCPASSQSGPSMIKLTMPELVQYRTKLMQSGIFLVRYQTE